MACEIHFLCVYELRVATYIDGPLLRHSYIYARRFIESVFVDFSAERREFLKHLATLRGEANTFLAMLNDTRRQVRELYYSGSNGDGAVGIQAYRYEVVEKLGHRISFGRYSVENHCDKN